MRRDPLRAVSPLPAGCGPSRELCPTPGAGFWVSGAVGLHGCLPRCPATARAPAQPGEGDRPPGLPATLSSSLCFPREKSLSGSLAPWWDCWRLSSATRWPRPASGQGPASATSSAYKVRAAPSRPQPAGPRCPPHPTTARGRAPFFLPHGPWARGGCPSPSLPFSPGAPCRQDAGDGGGGGRGAAFVPAAEHPRRRGSAPGFLQAQKGTWPHGAGGAGARAPARLPASLPGPRCVLGELPHWVPGVREQQAAVERHRAHQALPAQLPCKALAPCRPSELPR